MTYYNTDSGQCEPCSADHYQPLQAQLYCVPCQGHLKDEITAAAAACDGTFLADRTDSRVYDIVLFLLSVCRLFMARVLWLNGTSCRKTVQTSKYDCPTAALWYLNYVAICSRLAAICGESYCLHGLGYMLVNAVTYFFFTEIEATFLVLNK